MTTPIVFFDIAGPDSEALKTFYATVFGWDVDARGGMQINVSGPLHGIFRADPADKVLYLGVPDVTAALDKVAANGGSIHAPRFEVPGVVILGLFRDPAGNMMGLVEMDGERAKIP